MILYFADKATEDVCNGLNSKSGRRIPQSVWRVATRKLDMLNAAYELRDILVPPANGLEALKGTGKGHYSIRLKEQYRIVFKWIDGNAKDILITNYH